MEKIQNYIDGALVNPISNQYLDNYEPSTAEVYSHIPDSDKKDVDAAVKAAKQAFPAWSKTTKDKRSAILYRISELIEENLEELAAAESKDNGKPVSLATKVDIPRAAHNFRFFATAILHFASESHQMEEGAINYTLKQAIGVAGCISPWNLPLYLFSWKIAPALAAGNCVVAKPSEITPMSAFLLSKLCIEAGLPKGVLNIVHGLGHKVGAAITEHDEIPVISFTGGTATGAQIAKTAAPMFKKLSLELGGKNPTLIFDDCNYDKMLRTVVHSSFANQGQICLCGSRLLIHSSIYERFKSDFVREVKKLKVGNPKNADTNQGALVSKAHMEKVLSHIEIAKEEGGKVLCGGYQVDLAHEGLNGWFIEPTVIEGLNMDCRTNQEEIFGPVVTMMPFDTDEEAITYSNSTKYGLAASVWTENISRANQVAEQLHMGIVWTNCWLLRDLRTPFGGVKQSGVGREGGFEALRFFTEPKNVCIKY
ncbi:MAG: aldehyde dehydrogenase [Flavobacteriales bacterium]|nr:aldehyde dehydrogenase [Flavobacteriales bacterium]